MKNGFIEKLRADCAANDAKRDAGLTDPEDVIRRDNIAYGPDGPWNMLDVYYPQGTDQALPTIISVHGGGWVYGDKELYSHYCLRLAQRGFTVVNFTYRLAPEYRYPAQLEDVCRVAAWVQQNAEAYYIDLNNIFMVGDSAGGQLCYQFLAMLTNPAYAKQFPFRAPEHFTVNACGLNCGCYSIPLGLLVIPNHLAGIMPGLLPKKPLAALNQLRIRPYVTGSFPPAHFTTAENDFLKFMAAPFHKDLVRKGVTSRLSIYGTKAQKEIAHVFHVDCRLPLAKQCNDEQCAFFRAHMR